MVFRCLVYTLAVAMCALIVPVYSQVNTPPCSPSMNTSFIPCLILLANSTTNGSTTPTSDCCKFLRTLKTRTGMDCLCLIVTGSVPFQIPFNRSLALSLPRVCRMPSMPLQCKAAAAAPISPTGVDSGVPSTNSGSRSTLTPSAAASTYDTLPFIITASGATFMANLMLF